MTKYLTLLLALMSLRSRLSMQSTALNLISIAHIEAIVSFHTPDVAPGGDE